ncbi:MAG: hypothetical protein R3C59_07090 [Planctomycetaceae bacterium]
MSLTALRSIINATLLTIAAFINITAAIADEAPQPQAGEGQKPAARAADQLTAEEPNLIQQRAEELNRSENTASDTEELLAALRAQDGDALKAAPKEPSAATTVEQFLRLELVKAELERDYLKNELSADHPKVVAACRRIDVLRIKLAIEEEKIKQQTDSKNIESGDTTAQNEQPEGLLDKSALAGCDLHVVGMYMPKDNNRDDRVFVDVKATGKPMVLVLTGYFGAEWHLNIDPQADVRQVIVPGYYKHEMAEPQPACPVTFLTYFPKADKKNRNYFWAYAWHTAEGRELRRRLNELTGLEVTTFQGEYAATRFVIDGTRGRDVVTGKTNGDERPSGLGGLLQNLIGSSDTDDRPPLTQPPADDNSTKQPDTETSKPVIRTQLEAAREQAEAVHRNAEQASLRAAHDYRDELSQASPDTKALADRRQRLHQAVKAAFEAQMQLQQIRLQIAQQDLAEVQAKHQQRQTLADRIIERRVADLMSGENLDWQTKTQGQPRDSGTRLTRANGEAEADHGSDGKPPRRVGFNEAATAGKPDLKHFPELTAATTPTFSTPQELLAYWEKVGGRSDATDLEQYLAVIENHELSKIAGFLLRCISMLRVSATHATGCSHDSLLEHEGRFVIFSSELSDIMHRSILPQAGADSIAAREYLSEANQAYNSKAFRQQLSVDAYSHKLSAAAYSLRDHRKFVLDVLTFLNDRRFRATADGDRDNGTPPAEWKITRHHDMATAVNQKNTGAITRLNVVNELLTVPRTITLHETDGTWRISKILPDEVLIQIQDQQRVVRRKTDELPPVPFLSPLVTLRHEKNVDAPEMPTKNFNAGVDTAKKLEEWLKDIRSIGSDAAAKRDSALKQVEEALNSYDDAQNIAATDALAQTGDVKYEKAKYRERILELCRSSNRDLVKSALYALYNTDRKPEDLALAQEVLSKPEAAWAGHSISHLLLLFGDGEISGKSEEIVLTLLNSSDHSIRREALRGLWGAKTSDKLMDRVIELVDDAESHHDAIYFALSTSPDKNKAVVDKLIETLSDPDWNNWDRALWGLGYGVRESEQQKVADAMLQMIENRSDPKTQEKCARLIQTYGSEEQKARLSETTGQ